MYEMNSRKENQHRSCLWRLGSFGPAAFSATLCSAATDIARRQGYHLSGQGVELKLRAIAQVNEILGDFKLALSDETIAAVLALAMHEACKIYLTVTRKSLSLDFIASLRRYKGLESSHGWGRTACVFTRGYRFLGA
jgi:hypothetical protein